MYKLKIRLNTNGDFSHRSTFISNTNPEVQYIFNSRNQAIKVLKEFYDELDNTISCDKIDIMLDYIITIKDFKPYLFKLVHYFNSMHVNFQIGNPSFEIEFVKVEKEERNTYKGTFLTEIITHSPAISITVTPNFKNDYNWDALKKINKKEDKQ